MATAPERVRRVLLRVASRARQELRAVAQDAGQDPKALRAALFAAAPLVVSDYNMGAATLALDWYEELRDEVAPRSLFTPTPRLRVTDEDVAATVARTTAALLDATPADLPAAIAESMANLEGEVQRKVASTFRDTVIGNVADDQSAVGWRRFARPEACKFCLMLADRGAVYTAATARFAAHGREMRGGRKGGECMCLAGPAFGGEDVEKASAMQYVASKKRRTEKERAALRDYLNRNFPDAHG